MIFSIFILSLPIYLKTDIVLIIIYHKYIVCKELEKSRSIKYLETNSKIFHKLPKTIASVKKAAIIAIRKDIWQMKEVYEN